ncbi:hypothetical protein GIB67_002205 [Kingdonia uniflora]|uniref:Leucine-rich repeat-containing N-terminal plant-type domain-containing protein n=1 Tax=Kingdonia uniflora TaxID=39325 RepID=A0A7J7KX19_9MAGN|nr:hypothetical protein GIB67_002205 [Kingdonia uniflora]
MVLLFLFVPLATRSVNDTDRLALFAFKDKITQDPLRVMSLWNNIVHFCNWTGVTCSPVHHQRVKMLKLDSLKLVGSISPSIGNLTFLTGLSLTNNGFSGEIPEELGCLLQLKTIVLSSNSLEDQLSSLTKLVYFDLSTNHFTRNIPPWIGNFSELGSLILMENSFHGRIPIELGQISLFEDFNVAINMLSGTVPSSLYNSSSFRFFSVAGNYLEGRLPPNIGVALPILQEFHGGLNNFTGPIPASFSNISGLQYLDLPNNSFTGLVPTKLGTLQGLINLNFKNNHLGSGHDEANELNVLAYFTNCTNLRLLSLTNILVVLYPSSFEICEN